MQQIEAEDQSFGVVPVFTKPDGTFLFCLVLHAGGHFAFPKGHADEGETPKESALRELKEETGLVVDALADEPVFIEKYSFNREGVRYHKTVTYFLGMVSSMQSETMDDFKDEITEINWVPYHDAKHVLTFPAAQEILNQVFTYLEDSKKAASL